MQLRDSRYICWTVINKKSPAPKMELGDEDIMTDFQKAFEQLCRHRSRWEVWSDFIKMSAIAISNSLDMTHFETRENEYMTIIKRYNQEEVKLFPELLGSLAVMLDKNPDQDLLGKMYMELNLGDKDHGQFFTPYGTSELMAKLSLTEKSVKDEIDKRGFIMIHEPACGAGATLIAARSWLSKHGYKSREAWFVGQDLSRSAALMCYVQLSLLGCAGAIVVGDTLTQPAKFRGILPVEDGNEVWYMPMMFLDAWPFRMATGKIFK